MSARPLVLAAVLALPFAGAVRADDPPDLPDDLALTLEGERVTVAADGGAVVASARLVAADADGPLLRVRADRAERRGERVVRGRLLRAVAREGDRLTAARLAAARVVVDAAARTAHLEGDARLEVTVEAAGGRDPHPFGGGRLRADAIAIRLTPGGGFTVEGERVRLDLEPRSGAR